MTLAQSDLVGWIMSAALIALAVLVGVVIMVRFVQFWIGFAQGMNEAGEAHRRGFTVGPKPEGTERRNPADRKSDVS